MKSFVSAMDGLPWILKLILAFPGLDIVWGIYRIVKGLNKNDMVMVFAGLIWILVGWAVFWIIDIITVILSGRPTVFA
ncbi:MAG: hypothetical protein NUK62_00555 [Tenericutes bacterium]|jgi:hypothetical protein|nr:hypothetical protein [Mycoplasmatota bacterium]